MSTQISINHFMMHFLDAQSIRLLSRKHIHGHGYRAHQLKKNRIQAFFLEVRSLVNLVIYKTCNFIINK